MRSMTVIRISCEWWVINYSIRPMAIYCKKSKFKTKCNGMPCPSMLVNHSRKLRQYVSKFWAVSKLSVDLLGILIRRLMFMFVKSFPTSQSLCDFPPKLSIYNESVDRWFVLMQLMHVNQICFFFGRVYFKLIHAVLGPSNLVHERETPRRTLTWAMPL